VIATGKTTMTDWTNTNFGPPYSELMNTVEGRLDDCFVDRDTRHYAGELNNLLFEAYPQSYHIHVDRFISEVLDVIHTTTDTYFRDFIRLRK
jgi:phenylacetate-coenzyme A ligase PaaK-like adenylate-forming protein